MLHVACCMLPCFIWLGVGTLTHSPHSAQRATRKQLLASDTLLTRLTHTVCFRRSDVLEYITMGPGPGLVARVLWLYYMRLASSGVGVGGVRRVRLALLYVGSCVGVLWMMFWMRLASSGVGGVHRVPVRRLAAPVHPSHTPNTRWR